MRVQANNPPITMTLESYLPMSGYVELRLRENVTKVSSEIYEYDEYTILLKDREGLAEEIEANINDWLITGRTLEVNENASIIQDMKKALEILGVNTDEN